MHISTFILEIPTLHDVIFDMTFQDVVEVRTIIIHYQLSINTD